jgi:hypothetical protein
VVEIYISSHYSYNSSITFWDVMMKTMSAKEIKDHYGAFVETARREPVVHTNHGRPTLVTISIDRARTIPQLCDDIGATSIADKKDRMSRLLAMGRIGVRLQNPQSVEELIARSREFRGNE